MMHRCDNCPGTDALFEFLDKKLGEFYADEHFHSLHWETTDRTSLLTITTTFEVYKEVLITAINSLRKYSFLAKC